MERSSHFEPFKTLGGRFSLEILIKKHLHGMETWKGRDLQTHADVLIKIAPREALTQDHLHRLEREAEALRQSSAADQAPRLIETNFEDDFSYLVLRYLPGTTLDERLLHGPLPLSSWLSLAVAMLTELRLVHERGILHRDIKPSNILLPEDLDFRKAVLIDFGFAYNEVFDESVALPSSGTILYLSPEQAGTLAQPQGENSDLYSLGCVLYECATGKPPFSGATIGEILRAHINVVPSQIASVRQDIPRILSRFVERLMAKNVDERYASAESALKDLESIAAALTQGEKNPWLVLGLQDPRNTLNDPSFVGRQNELKILEREFEKARAGRGTLVLIEGESGGGKSRLLQEFHPSHALVLRGQGIDQAAQRPYQVLAGVIAGALHRCRSDSNYATRLKERLKIYGGVLCDALPELKELFGDLPRENLGPETLAEMRSLRAMSELLCSLGDADCPCLITLDDCQWADDLSLKLIGLWQNSADGEAVPPRYINLVVAFRTEEVDSSHRLRQLKHFEPVLVKPFGADEIQAFLTSMAGPLHREVIDTVVSLAQGNPFMSSAILQGLLETGALVPEARGWRVDASALREARASKRAAYFLAKRLKDFPERSREFLTIGAVIGKEFSTDLVKLLWTGSPTELSNAVDEAIHRKVIWATDPQRSKCLFVHDKIRETLLSLLPPEDRVDYHLRLARHLQKTQPAPVFELAYHFDAAGLHREALPYAIDGARQARKQYALKIACRYFSIAARGMAFATEEQRFEISESLGELYMLRGKYSDAETHFRRAIEMAHDKTKLAHLQGKLGELEFKRGDIQSAAISTETALRSLDRWVPRHKIEYVAAAALEIAVQTLHSLFPKLFLARRTWRNGESDRVAIRLYSRLAYIYWFGKGKVPCLWTHLKGLNLAERYPETLELAQSYSEHAPVMTLIPWFSRGTAYVKRSLAIRERLGDIWGQGQSLHFYGTVLYSSSQFEKCIETCERAIRLMERAGDQWELNTATWHMGFAHLRKGELLKAVQNCRKTYEAGIAIQDHQASGISLSGWARATLGDVPADLIETEKERPTGDIHTRVEILLAEAVCNLRRREPAAAVAGLGDAYQLIRKNGMRQEYIAPIYPWLATAERELFESIDPMRVRERKRLLRKFRRSVGRALRMSHFYRNNRPHALRESALLQAYLGFEERAKRQFAQSLELAADQGAHLEQAQTLIAQGRLGLKLDWPGAAETFALGEAQLEELLAPLRHERLSQRDTPANTLSLADRFSSLLVLGRSLMTSLSKQTVFEHAQRAALQLLRAEKCSIIEFSADSKMHVLPYGSPVKESEISHSLVEAVRSNGRILSVDQAGIDVKESVMLSDYRSLLLVPLRVGDRIAAILYLSHSRLERLFGDTENQIAEFLATLAGAALENAEGFDTLKRVSDERNGLYQQAEKALRIRDEFISIASHELRTPLTSLILQTQLLGMLSKQDGVRSIPEEDFSRFIKNADTQLGQLKRLVGDLLDVSKLSTGQLTLQKTPSNLATVVGSVLSRYEHDLKRAGCPFEFHVNGSVNVSMDRNRIEQVLANLITNAIKYAKNAPIEVSVGAQSGNGYIRFHDSGPGIPSEHQSRIFERFERIVSKDNVGGLGLGLYISAQIMKAHGGAIRVESRPGSGTTFILELPLVEKDLNRDSTGPEASA